MKRVIFECAGNCIGFILLGLIMVEQFVFRRVNEFGVQILFQVNAIHIILFVFTIVFLAIRFFGFRRKKRPMLEVSELAYADEREKAIVAEATKKAYIAAMVCLVLSLGAMAWTRIGGMLVLQRFDIDMYVVGVTLIVVTIVVIMVTYCVTWCREYRK